MERRGRHLIAFWGGVVIAVMLGNPWANAAEGFVCGPDRIVYVEAHELEEKKRTDPCVAAFFGLKVETPSATQPVATPMAGPAATPVVAPQPAGPKPSAVQPARKPVKQPARNEMPSEAPVVKATVSLKPLPGEVPQRALKSRSGEQAALTLPAMTAPGTDYRKVRVINAQSAETAWFHHVR